MKSPSTSKQSCKVSARLHAAAMFLRKVISIYLQDDKCLSRLSCTFASFIPDEVFSNLHIPEMQKPDSDVMQREMDLSDLVNLKGPFYLAFSSLLILNILFLNVVFCFSRLCEGPSAREFL